VVCVMDFFWFLESLTTILYVHLSTHCSDACLFGGKLKGDETHLHMIIAAWMRRLTI